jgi:predicted RNA binding protein YcfA (HicA-like mRNA interferase family)
MTMPQVSQGAGLHRGSSSGSHLTLRHETRSLTVTIPMHTGADIGRGLAIRILKDAGFTIEEFLRLR